MNGEEDGEMGKPAKRLRNPLVGRVLRDIVRDWRRYLLIFVMLVMTIGFVSGMYVANNSMMTSLEGGAATHHREDGHFLLSGKADEETIAGIESGDLADVVAEFRERAYDEARSEVQNAVKDAVSESVRERVREAIRQQSEAAVNEQLSAAEAAGATFTDEERQLAIEEAQDAALRENFAEAYEEALTSALGSEEYASALADAWEKAKKEIDGKIDEEYDELADRYGLDEDFEPVPVTVYELFYKETEETVAGNGDYSGTVRVYSERDRVNLYDLIKGRAPKNDSEIVVDRMHANNVGIAIGDILNVGDTEFEVVGLVSFVDYSTLYQNNTDTMFDALTFNVAMTTDEGFERIGADVYANYAFTYNDPPADEYEEKDRSERFLKALVTQTVVSDGTTEIKDYVPAYANQAIIFAPDDMGSDKAMGGALLYILTAVLAFIFAVSVSAMLEQESSVIGTLRASGYTRGELLRYYMSAPLIVVTAAAVVGNILGYTLFKQIIIGMYYNSYSLPAYKTLWTPEAFIRTTVVPVVLMLLINLIIITRKLRLSPLRFLRHDLKNVRRKKSPGLPAWGFLKRYRARVFLQNIPGYLMLFVGITFVMVLLSMSVGMPTTLSYYQDSVTDMVLAKEQVILSEIKDEKGNAIETETPGAERFSITTLLKKSDVYDEEVTVYGVVDGSAYVRLGDDFYGNASSEGEIPVYISRAYSEKYGVRAGDVIVLSEKYEHKDYRWRVYGIYEYEGGIAVFMTNAQFNAVFDKKLDSFSGYMADESITDIDGEYTAKTVTGEDLIKMARQLDHSMGSYMLYFQYVCMIVAAIILYLISKIIIDKNEGPISMAKILGYEDGEIASIYMIPTAIVVFFSEFLAIYLGFVIMQAFWKSIMMELGGWFSFVMTPAGFVKEFVLVLAAYLAITVFDYRRIRKIPKALALKNME